jgi:hypothetical protein
VHFDVGSSTDLILGGTLSRDHVVYFVDFQYLVDMTVIGYRDTRLHWFCIDLSEDLRRWINPKDIESGTAFIGEVNHAFHKLFAAVGLLSFLQPTRGGNKHSVVLANNKQEVHETP